MDMWHQNGHAACGGSGHWKGKNLSTERKIKALVFKGVIFEIPKGEKIKLRCKAYSWLLKHEAEDKNSQVTNIY